MNSLLKVIITGISIGFKLEVWLEHSKTFRGEIAGVFLIILSFLLLNNDLTLTVAGEAYRSWFFSNFLDALHYQTYWTLAEDDYLLCTTVPSFLRLQIMAFTVVYWSPKALEIFLPLPMSCACFWVASSSVALITSSFTSPDIKICLWNINMQIHKNVIKSDLTCFFFSKLPLFVFYRGHKRLPAVVPRTLNGTFTAFASDDVYLLLEAVTSPTGVSKLSENEDVQTHDAHFTHTRTRPCTCTGFFIKPLHLHIASWLPAEMPSVQQTDSTCLQLMDLNCHIFMSPGRNNLCVTVCISVCGLCVHSHLFISPGWDILSSRASSNTAIRREADTELWWPPAERSY